MPGEDTSVANPGSIVQVCVPPGMPYQLVFRMLRTQAFDVPPKASFEFHFVGNLLQLLPLARRLKLVVSAKEWLKSFVRVGVGRKFYCVTGNGAILHSGWITRSFCRHYKINRDEVVIGPIWTAPAGRGNGLATFAAKRAINELTAKGASVFYIDTSSDNSSCLHVIANCGFGTAIACMPRRLDDRDP